MKNLTERSRFYILSAISSIVIICLFVGIGLFFNYSKQNKTADSIQLTKEQNNSITSTVRDFVLKSGKFGIYYDLVKQINDGDGVREILIDNDNSNKDLYWYSRSKNYLSLRNTFILPESNVYYDDNTVNNWMDVDTINNLSSYTTQDVRTNIPSLGQKAVYKNNKVPSVNINVSFSSVETIFLNENNPSVDIHNLVGYKRIIPNNSFSMTLYYVNNNWMIYSMDKNFSNSFLLSTYDKFANNYSQSVSIKFDKIS